MKGKPFFRSVSQSGRKKVGKAISTRVTSGGRATLWSDEEFSLESSFETQHWIYTELCHITSKLTLSLFNLYVMVLHLEKKDCWLTLADFIEIYTPWNIIIAGYLNLIFDSKEKRGGNNSKDQMSSLV